ncbi:MAG: diguanylate cyclase [Nevskia sp.]|nr:diguanylate cyclase [Nevskia sp.]
MTLSLLLAAADAGAAVPVGSPPIARFVPDIQVYPQHFDVAEDNAAVVYVASNDGVLIFDGVRWKLLALPNGDVARSLAYDGHDRVYVGGYNLFGYIQRDPSGAEVFHDLTALYRGQLHGESFADVWNVLVTPRGVFFMAQFFLFQYAPESQTFRLWHNPGQFGALVDYRGEIVVQFRGEGLKSLRGADWQLVSGSEALSDVVYQLLHLPDGGLLTLARDGRWREFHDGRVADFPMPAGFPPSSFMSVGRELADGTVALAGEDGQLHLLDAATHRVTSFRVDSSALDGVVQAADGGLLTLSNLAVFHVDWPNSWSAIGRESGLNGVLHGIAHWGGRWLALTDAGVYEAVESNGAAPAFRRLDWTDFEAWDLLPLDERDALLAESYSIKLIRAGHASRLVGTRSAPLLLHRSRFDPDLIYVGTESGLAVLHREGGDWRLKFDADGIETSRVKSLAELGPRELLVGSDRGGVHRLRLADDFSHIAELRGFGKSDGIEYGNPLSATVSALDDGSILATSASGIYRWSGGRFEHTDLDGLEPQRQPGEELALLSAPGGDLWAYGYARIYHRRGAGPWVREHTENLQRGSIETATFDGRDTVLFGANSEMLRYDAGLAPPAVRPELALRSAERLDDRDGVEALPLRPASPPQFTQDGLALRFRIALPDYRNPQQARYQAHVKGLDDHFPDWSESRTYTYRRLPPGEYQFEARARDSFGRVSEIEPFRFVVRPYWYETPWVRALELLLLAGLALLLSQLAARLRTRRLAVENARLEDVVRVRTRELEAANRRLDKMAHLDGLTEIPNRRRLNDYLSQAWSRCSEQGRPVAVLVIDADHFKQYNDRHGHLAGDEVLKRLTQILTGCLRRNEDLVARFGGDEFVAVLPDAGPAVAAEVAEIMRRKVEESAVGVTISVGYASRMPQPDETVWALVHEVDGALYEAKRGGRNRVTGYTGTARPGQAGPS